MSERGKMIKKELPKGRSLWKDGLRRLRRNRLAVVCFVVIVLYFLLAGYIYLAELFDWRVGPMLWAKQVGNLMSRPVLKTYSARIYSGSLFCGRRYTEQRYR